MEVIDLSPHYLRLAHGEIGQKDYIRSHRAFFDHYQTFWAPEWPMKLKGSEPEVEHNRTLVLQHLQFAVEKLEKANLSCAGISALLFVGPGGANGHAFCNDGKFIAWFDVSEFTTELRAKVFVTHELVHALHYSKSPEFYFKTANEKNSTWRQLITEGIATYITQHIWDLSDEAALWSDYLQQSELRSWMKECKTRNEELFNYILRNWYSSDTLLFNSVDPSDIFSYRAGYYGGLNVIRKIVAKEGFSFPELLTASASLLKPLMKEAITSN